MLPQAYSTVDPPLSLSVLSDTTLFTVHCSQLVRAHSHIWRSGRYSVNAAAAHGPRLTERN